jgi:exonuclease SbcD
MKFIHAADIHLDSPLAGLRARDDLPDHIVRHSTRRAFSRMIDLARDEDVAFVVIAGDLYDGDWKDFSTGLFFAEEMRRLARPCFLLRGNHDARSVIARGLKLPENVREFSSRACQTFQLPDLGVSLHGHSFPNRAVPEDLSAGYAPPAEGMLNIGVLHTSCEEPEGEHKRYAPCTPASLTLKGYDYWALGHIHMRQELSRRPWIVFPGNLQGRHPKETGPKGCSLVTVEDRRIVSVEHRSVDVLRWAALAADASGLDEPALIAAIGETVRAAIAEADDRPVLARLSVTGTTDLHGALLNDTDRLVAECRNAAIEADGQLWVESVKIGTRPVPSADAGTLTELREAFFAGLGDPELTAKLRAEFASLRQKVPARADLDLADDDASLKQIAEDAWQLAASAIAATAAR